MAPLYWRRGICQYHIEIRKRDADSGRMSDDKDEESTPPPVPQLDGLLYVLVGVVNAANNKTDGTTPLEVTLLVKGTIVSGTIVSRRDYVLANPVLESIDEVIESEAKKDGSPRPASKDFIHLKDARIFAPGQPPIPSTDPTGFFWRIRLSSVDGFTVGGLKVTKE